MTRPEVMKSMCWALVSILFHLPYKVTSTNIRRWEWKGDQQKKKAITTTTASNAHDNVPDWFFLPSILMTTLLPLLKTLRMMQCLHGQSYSYILTCPPYNGSLHCMLHISS